MIGFCKQLILTYFANDSAYGTLVPDIPCYDNYLYSLYESINARDDFGIPE